MLGWLVTVVISAFFNPLDPDEDRFKDFRDRLLSYCVLNIFLWPLMLPAYLDRRRLMRDIRTGNKPNWIIKSKGEESGRVWHLSDGTEFSASATTSGASSEPADILADYEDDSLTGEIEFRVRMVAPTSQSPSEWRCMTFTPRRPQPDPDDADAMDDYGAERYEASAKLERGKYEVEFRVPNRDGKVEECSAVTMVVSDLEDYE
jgi:hypothetical protein